MWQVIAEKFRKYPNQIKVAQFLLKKGLRVNEEGKICLGEIEIPSLRIATALGVDRRVVDATAKRIRADRELFRIFSALDAVCFLRDVAPHLGLNVIIITPEDASKPGIVGEVASKLAEAGISIRQAIADDPYLNPDPKLTIITEEDVKGEIIKELKKLPGVKEITLL